MAKAILVVTTDAARARPLAAALSDLDVVVQSDAVRAHLEVQQPWRLVLVDADYPEMRQQIAAGVKAGNRVLLLAREPVLSGVMDGIAHGALDVIRDARDVRVLRRWLGHARGQRPDWRQSSQEESGFMWVGRSAATTGMMTAAARAAQADANVLLLGERGVGKESLARVVHARGARASGDFIPIHCGALDQVALSAELFGTEVDTLGNGSAPGQGQLERAGGGVVYLEEISALNPAVQTRLARALSEGSFTRLGSMTRIPLQARVMASAITDLRREVHEGRFDERLYYEFGVQLHVPALRHRNEDIPLLAAYFLEQFNREYGRSVSGFSSDALAVLGKYDWPGNVRQLRHAIERALVGSGGDVIEASDLANELTGRRDEVELADTDDLTLDSVERRHIRRVLQMAGGRISEAADLLGIHRNTLRRKLELYGISTEG